MYYIPDRRHPTLTTLIRKHCEFGSAIMSDMMTSYVRPKTFSSRLDQYGYYHFYFDHANVSIHEKFSFIYTNTVRMQFLSLKKHISSYQHVYVPVEKTDQYIHSFMYRKMVEPDKLYNSTLHQLKLLQLQLGRLSDPLRR